MWEKSSETAHRPPALAWIYDAAGLDDRQQNPIRAENICLATSDVAYDWITLANYRVTEFELTA